ncbi:hypothetical protein [Gordonia sp. 852002-50395_SCH5434458]|uniref:hypothetical protein n=1 Tax=Gordonia sp. 852002-50395_SCH5434458 TaxID=1834090 RepID=UPI0007E9DDBA|nr:hypothetical protein [Gordonia sp. 852002-50395_SCH5434458]OBC01740.1 hypothetical protein A5785_17225 [Gordonia sp. 852002-50395_SCH5434458]
MTRDELVTRLWLAIWIVDQVGIRMQRRRDLRATQQTSAVADELARIDVELGRLRSQYASAAGGLIPTGIVDIDTLTAVTMVIEEGRANSVLGAIRVLREDEQAALDRASDRRVAAIQRDADHQARMSARQAAYADARRVRWAIEDFGRTLR